MKDYIKKAQENETIIDGGRGYDHYLFPTSYYASIPSIFWLRIREFVTKVMSQTFFTFSLSFFRKKKQINSIYID